VLNNATSCLPRNPASAFAYTARKPALGPSFAFLTDATLWLARPQTPEGEKQEPEPEGGGPEPETRADDELRVAEVFRSKVSVRARAGCLV